MLSWKEISFDVNDRYSFEKKLLFKETIRGVLKIDMLTMNFERKRKLEFVGKNYFKKNLSNAFTIFQNPLIKFNLVSETSKLFFEYFC